MNEAHGGKTGHVNIHIGGVYASRMPTEVRTVLGSCVAACLYDAARGIGGMNHFMLPGDPRDGSLPTRYGVNAMELLINEIMRLGGDRRRLQAKVFGGADLMGFQGSKIGTANAEFVRSFLETENIPIVASRLGGRLPLSVRFFTGTARALVKAVEGGNLRALAEQERKARTKLAREARSKHDDDITLF